MVPNRAPEEPKPLNFANPSPWSALPKDVYVGTGRDEREEATTESPVGGRTGPRSTPSTTAPSRS